MTIRGIIVEGAMRDSTRDNWEEIELLTKEILYKGSLNIRLYNSVLIDDIKSIGEVWGDFLVSRGKVNGKNVYVCYKPYPNEVGTLFIFANCKLREHMKLENKEEVEVELCTQ